jgi:hypothetical protein
MNEKAGQTEHVLMKQSEISTAGKSLLKARVPKHEVNLKEEQSQAGLLLGSNRLWLI